MTEQARSGQHRAIETRGLCATKGAALSSTVTGAAARPATGARAGTPAISPVTSGPAVAAGMTMEPVKIEPPPPPPQPTATVQICSPADGNHVGSTTHTKRAMYAADYINDDYLPDLLRDGLEAPLLERYSNFRVSGAPTLADRLLALDVHCRLETKPWKGSSSGT